MPNPMTTELAEKENKPRVYQSKRLSGFNLEVYNGWIERWANNAVRNYPIINEGWGVRFLTRSAVNIPAIAVGIGPSLDKDIETLKLAQGRALIFSTDAALRPLLRHGIKPHIVMNYDARDDLRSMWDTIETSDLVLVASSLTSSQTLDAWGGKFLFFNPEQADDEFCANILPAVYPHLGGLPNMGTVGNGIIYLAHLMGCYPVLGVGMDLCYQPIRSGDDFHEKEVWRYRCADYLSEKPSLEFPEGRWVKKENKVLYDNDDRLSRTFDEEFKGETFKVDEPLQFYRNSLINHAGTQDFSLINTATNGILKKVVRTMPLKEALDKYARRLHAAETSALHLGQLIPDCKQGRVFRGEYWEGASHAL